MKQKPALSKVTGIVIMRTIQMNIIVNKLIRFAGLLLLGSLLTACGAPAWKTPIPIEQVDFMTHATTLTKEGTKVTVSVLSKKETEQVFGTSLYADQIQPVWVEVDNQTDNYYFLVKAGIDRMNFSPYETSYQRHSGSKKMRLEMDEFFNKMSFTNPVEAQKVTSGFIFTRMDEGYKAINVDLVGDERLKNYSFVAAVPDSLQADHDRVDFDTIYDEWIDIEDEDELRKILASLPCCTRNKKGTEWGDPLNIVMIGDGRNIFSALIRSDWHQTEVTYAASLIKTVKSFLFGSHYRYSPISPLFVFDRQQDIGLQKARGSISLRNHMRLWRTPYNYQGKEVYIGQISRDIGVKFNKRTFTTHVIDPDVDDTRSTLIGDLAYSQSVIQIGFVGGSQSSTMEDTHYNLTPDPYYSDGYRAVIFFDERPTTLDEIDLLDWEKTRMNQTLE